MFIREVKKRKNGKTYYQYHLVESIRTSFGPRQNIILILGDLSLEKEKWKDLANAIEAELNNQLNIFEVDSNILQLAKYYASLIIKNRQNKIVHIENKKESIDDDYENINLNSLNNTDVRTIGLEHILSEQMNEHGLNGILRKIGFNQKQIIVAKVLIAGRVIHPSSERELVRWIKENSALLEVFKSNLKINDNTLHTTAVLIWKHHEYIELELSKKAKELFSLEETILLYDLTNTYFEANKNESLIAKISRSKDKRNDRPLITLALATDEEGFPKQSRILEGNISEPKTLEKVLDDLSTDGIILNPEKTIVIDAGIGTEDNLKLIKNKHFNYITVSRKKSYPKDFWSESKEKEIQLSDEKTKLKFKLVRTDDEAYLLCKSEAKEIKENAIFERKVTKFEEELTNLNQGLQKQRTQKKYEKIVERIGRLKEKYKVGNLYDIEIQANDGMVTEIRFKRKENYISKENKCGEYVLRTNRLDLEDEKITQIHRSLTKIEDCFKSMKSDLGMRPNYHQNDIPMMAHIFITVIGYHFLAAIQKKLSQANINYRWNTVRNIFSTFCRVTIKMNNEKGDSINIRANVQANEKQQRILSALKIKESLLGRIKQKYSKGSPDRICSG